MGQDDVDEFAAAIAGFDELDALLLPMLGHFGDATADSLACAVRPRRLARGGDPGR
jgi:hypothetical protein